MRKIYETAVILIGTLSWWGFVYPELCLTEEAYEQEAETISETETASEIRTTFKTEITSKTETIFKTASETEITSETEGGKTFCLPDQAVPGNFWEDGWKIGGLCIKSRAAEYVYRVKEKDVTEKELEYDKQVCTHRGF